MQKKLIALAVAGLVSAPAFAQSNVTVYGVADAGIAVGSHGANDLRGVQAGVLSGNRIGFRGTEDLGNGLSAVFQLEQGFNIDNGTDHRAGRQFSRQAFVGLKGAFGTVALGTQYAPGFTQQYDALASSTTLAPQAILAGGALLSIAPTNDGRWDNSVTYSNTFANVVKLNAIYSATGNSTLATTEVGASPNNDNAWGVGVEYANAGLRVGGVFHHLKDGADIGDNTREWLVGASYNFGMATIAGSYQRATDLTAADLDASVWQIGAIIPVSAAGNVHLAYGRADVERAGGLSDDEPTSWAVAYLHALSKRTTGYIGVNRTSNDETDAYRPAGLTSGGRLGKNANITTVGVRHTF